VPTIAKRLILSQGDRDSACFLYSLANAVHAITGEVVSESRWTSATEQLKYPCDYLSADTGTRKIDRAPSKLRIEAEEILSALYPLGRFKVSIIRPIDRSYDFSCVLSKQSVIVMANKQHWFCLLEVYKRRAFVACSAVWQDHGRTYAEVRQGKLEHLSNDGFPLSQLEFYKPWALLVASEA
jgi:hypothetical protein